jgi:hypothetical protein
MTGKLKPMLAYLVPVAVISLSLIWIVLDKSVWMWDEAFYGRVSVELFYALIQSPKHWILLMLSESNSRAPGMCWLGQFFVPLGYLLGSIDVALLLSILVTQALTLVLTYQATQELSGRNRQLVTVTGCLVIGSAPLFVAMSHQYLAEPSQLLAVAWFLVIMSFAPKWNRAFIFGQLLAATAVAMLAKVSSPLYCVGPGVVALWYVFKSAPSSLVKREWRQRDVIVTLAAGALLSSAAIAWYYRNVTYVIQHVLVSSSGPIAEIYGKKDVFVNTMIYWLGAIKNSFFLPGVFFLVGLVFGLAIISYFFKPKTVAKHFTLCASVAALQIMTVLVVFSFSSNREVRYLLPLLPYVALLICWSLAQIYRPILSGLTMLFFLVQLASTYGQALGVISLKSTTPGWLLAPNSISGQKERATLNSIVSRTCAKSGSQSYGTVIGIEKPWLNEQSAWYFAVKNLGPSRIGCYYALHFSFDEFDVDKTWSLILSEKTRYYVTVNPDSNPVALDAHSQAVNRNYLPMLKKVQSSGLFLLEAPLAEDWSILIFRRKDIDSPFRPDNISQ